MIIKGHEMKQVKLAALVRKHAQIVYACSGGKEDITNYWPIKEIDEKTKPKRPSKAFIKNMFQDKRRMEAERRLLSQQHSN